MGSIVTIARMRGLLSYGTHVPFRRLDRGAIKAFIGSGGGKGTRTAAAYDEDTTTMAVEACRQALRSVPEVAPDALWFSTVTPAYVDKTNATAVHAALRLDRDITAVDFGGAARSAVGSLLAALRSNDTVVVAAADQRTGLPGSADEAAGGDGAATLVVGDDTAGTVIAELLGTGSASSEFLDRWRAPGEPRSKQWEEKFGEISYVPAGLDAWLTALKAADLSADQVDRVVVSGLHARAAKSLTRKLGLAEGVLADDLSATVGNTGAAHASLLLASVLDDAEPGQVVVVVSLADGADVVVFRATDAIAGYANGASVADQIAASGDIAYAKFLAARGLLAIEPPRRPEPARTSSSAAARGSEWKFGFVAAQDRESGAVHMPPGRVSMVGGNVDDMEPLPMADEQGTIVTFTVDRLAYSPSPPVIFAVVDFDGGGRLPVELTDVDVDDVAIGGRVAMTFRRLSSSDDIHNYFWKARPVR